MIPTLVQIGLVEIAFAALLGWVLVVWRESPALLARAGVRSPRRILQCHLDQIMMGLILIAVGLAVPSLPAAIEVFVVFGTLVNPLLFLPQAFSDTVTQRLPYRVLTAISLLSTSGGLVAVAVDALAR
jgi:hypothetical protein